jgi:hypothetical protein
MDPTWSGASSRMISGCAFAFEFYAQSTIAVIPEHVRSEPSNIESSINLHEIFKQMQEKLKIGVKLAIRSAAIHPATC